MRSLSGTEVHILMENLFLTNEVGLGGGVEAMPWAGQGGRGAEVLHIGVRFYAPGSTSLSCDSHLSL